MPTWTDREILNPCWLRHLAFLPFPSAGPNPAPVSRNGIGIPLLPLALSHARQDWSGSIRATPLSETGRKMFLLILDVMKSRTRFEVIILLFSNNRHILQT